MKKTLKRIIATLAVAVMLLTAVPFSGLFSTKASAVEYIEYSYNYLYNMIETLGSIDENGNKYVAYCIDNNYDEYVSFTNISEYDSIQLSYFYRYGISVKGGAILINANSSTYNCVSVYEDDENDYVHASGVINPEFYDPYSSYPDLQIIEQSPYFENYSYTEDMLVNIVNDTIISIEYALNSYADISLYNFGFDCYAYSPYAYILESPKLNGLYRDMYSWRFYTDGDINYDFNGLAENYFGTWYVRNGGIDFSFTGFILISEENEYGETFNTYYYVRNGKVDYDFVGLVKDPDDGYWWYVDYGTINFYYVGLAKNDYGWWYVEDGTIDFSYTGMAKNDYGWWYAKNGKLDLTYTGMAKNDYGWWYMNKGKLDRTYTGMAKNQYGWWYMNKGKLDRSFVGLAKNQYGWWYIKNGTIDFKYNGYASNQYGTWKVVNGKVVA